MKRLIALVGVVVVGGWIATPPALEPPSVTLESVADSGTYYLYSFSVTNPGTSTTAISSFTVGVGATSGTPAPLAATGDFMNNASLSNAAGVEEPRAPVGPISPSGWTASLRRSAVIRWFAPSDGPFHTDSVAPDSTKGGFGIRSPYLPGIVATSAQPTWQACCSVPDPVTDQYPLADTFAVSGITVGPRYMASEIDLDLLQSQLTAVCTDPLWIDDTALCSALTDSLDAAEARLAINNVVGGRSAIESVMYMTVSNHEPSGDVNTNAFYLIAGNAYQLLENTGHAAAANMVMCVWAESTATGYFTITATGGGEQVTSPYSLSGEVLGVDPEGSGCSEVWIFPADGTALIDLTMRLDSVSGGSELDEIHYQGGLYNGDTISVATAQDSLLMTHDGSAGGQAVFVLKNSGWEQ